MSAYVMLQCDREVEGGLCGSRTGVEAEDVAAARAAAAADGWTHDATRGDACRACSGGRAALRLEFPSR